MENRKCFHKAGLLQLNCNRAKKELGWHPVLNFKRTVEFTSNWYVNFFNNENQIHNYSINQIEEFLNS